MLPQKDSQSASLIRKDPAKRNRGFLLYGALAVIAATVGSTVFAQVYAPAAVPDNSKPNPYRAVENWAKLPAGRIWGQTPTVDVDRKGHIWVIDRCGSNSCAGSPLAPILEFDSSGKLLNSFGAGMFAFPHGIFLDQDDNVWVTDGGSKDGKGNQVFKFTPDGKVLMTLGKAGVAGDGPDTFNRPSDVVVGLDGDIFVGDGHGEDSNARIVKFSKGGKFIKTWGKRGTAPGDFDTPHSLQLDSRGRLFVADRGNNRIQIFDQDGKFLDQWMQFGHPTGIFIDRFDNLYSADSDSDATVNPGWKRGIRIGSAKDGSVRAFIPVTELFPGHVPDGAAEGVAADAMGNVYGAEVGNRRLMKYVKN